MTQDFIKGAIALAVGTALCGSAAAKDLGALQTITSKDGHINITTADQELVRIDLITDTILRIWAGAENKLVDVADKAAKIVPQVTRPHVAYTLSNEGTYHLLKTNTVALRIYTNPLRFEAYLPDNEIPVWKELRPIHLSEGNSYQTLTSQPDEYIFGGGQQNGQYQFNGKNLEVSYSGGWEEGDRPSPAPFYMSTKGYGVLRNTWSNGRYDFRSDDYVTASHEENRFDAYYFFGSSIKQILSDYTALSGRAPLIPRWAFEYGDADCYNDGDNVKKPGTTPTGWSDGPTGTTPDVIASVAAKYREHDMPGGWILPNDGYGCGYTDLEIVVEGLQKYGFKTGLWTENGVEKIAWEVGTAGTRAQKLDVAWTGKGYQFALDANKEAAQGILDNSDSRPFLWTVMGWAGIQRYAVTWTGDQSGSWDYIRWHIPTLIGSGLSGQTYATGDVDGIFGGSAETYTRDLQWKAFTPVLMGMSGWSKTSRKHPWWFEEPYRSINRDYLKLKMRLTPYMYTYAHIAEQTGAPIVRGLMWDHAGDPNANSEKYKYQFFLGEDFLVAPVYRSQLASKGWRENIYLPEGNWIDYWDGRVTISGENGTEIDYPVTLEKLPIFVRAGAIIPMYPEALYDGQVAKDELTLDIYPHGESQFTLYEDDGNTRQYKQGASSAQTIRSSAPTSGAGDITITIEPTKGTYSGLEMARVYKVMLHTRTKPESLRLGEILLAELNSKNAFDTVTSGWFYDAADKYGTVHIKLAKTSVRNRLQLNIKIDPSAAQATTEPYPAMPDFGTAISLDGIKLISRPLEESGHPFENALDGNPDTWFRTSRDLSLATGPLEFTVYFGERKAISGFDISPRNDQHWKFGQVKDYEIYMSDSNGEWGKPAHTGTLKLSQNKQSVTFDPIVGSLLRFRIKTAQNTNTDEMQLVDVPVVDNSYNAMIPSAISSITISELTLHEYQPPKKVQQKTFLSDHDWSFMGNGLGPVERNTTLGAEAEGDGSSLKINGLNFSKGLSVFGNSRIDYKLSGDWQLFRADVGIDDSCSNPDGMRFQVWGDDRLLFDSGTVIAPAFVKPELDIRTIKTLSLRTVDDGTKGCGTWANPVLVGFDGDKINN